MSINVLVNGANGKMGQVTVDAVNAEADLNLIATSDKNDDLAAIIKQHQPDVVVDFTVPDSAFNNTKIIIENGVHPVIGTTGFTPIQIKELQQNCLNRQLGGIIAPNFSIGAILMMKYAADAARYFSDVEIIELHHPQKIDAPSGTAKKTAEMMASVRSSKNSEAFKNSARGENYQGIAVHSVRLPSLFAHQEVIFGGYGELLSIRHDAMDRKAIMPGVILACRKVMELNELIYGLENLI